MSFTQSFITVRGVLSTSFLRALEILMVLGYQMINAWHETLDVISGRNEQQREEGLEHHWLWHEQG